ncbi:hypothetical protein G7054_g7171 [Neopestalotiopsis clavispora]|nr:hypothetical protein G7054_g7171 [Neopestalotiopsis clavispora]
MSDTAYKPEQRGESDYFNPTTFTLADVLSRCTSSMLQQRSSPLRDVLKFVGDATASGQSVTREVVYAKVWENAWKSRMNIDPLPGEEILDWNLQYVTILMECDDLDSITFPPPGLEDLLSPNKTHMASKKRGELFSKMALLVLRKGGSQSLQMTREYLDLALKNYVDAKVYDKESLLPIAQDLADVLELQGDIGLASEYFGRESIIPRWLAKEVKQGRMSVARQWCESQKLDKDQFYEANFSETKDTQRLSPLALATIEEHREAFTAMLRFTARTVTPHRMSSIASKLLLLASDTCNSDFAKDLLDSGAQANTLDEHRRSSLHRLVLCRKFGDQGGFNMIKMLLDNDPSILDLKDDNGKTALILACEAEYPLKIKELLKYGADPNIQDSHSCSPFFIACEKGSDRMVKLFLDHDKVGSFKGTSIINALGPGKQTPLIAAVRYAARVDSKDSGALNAIKLLKQHGADPNLKDCEGLSALDYANGFQKTQIKHIFDNHTTMDSKLSAFSQIPYSRGDYASSVHSSHGHTSSGESSTAKQSSPTRPVGCGDKSETLRPKASTGDVIRSQVPPDNVKSPYSEFHVDFPGTEIDVVKPSCQGKPEALPLQFIKGNCKSAGSDVDIFSESADVVSSQSSDPEMMEEGDILQRTSNLDDAAEMSQKGETPDDFDDAAWAFQEQEEETSDDFDNASGMFQEGELSDDFDDDFSIWGSDDDFEDLANLNNAARPIDDSTDVSNPRNEGAQSNLEYQNQPKDQPINGKFACVYSKAYPERYPKCIREAFESIARLKQHLRRHHYVPFYCSRCQEVFNNQDARDKHGFIGGCQQRAPNMYENNRITEHQKSILSKCAPHTRGETKKQWYFVFDLLFKGCPRPETPWADSAPSIILDHVLSVLRRELHDKITPELVGRIKQSGVSEGTVPAAAPSPPSPENGLNMHDNPHEAAHARPPSVPQVPPLPEPILANVTPRFNQKSVSTVSHTQPSPTSSYTHQPNHFVGVPAGYQYHPSSHSHNNFNLQGNLVARWPAQAHQNLPGAFAQAQPLQTSENNFQSTQGISNAFLGNPHGISALTPEIFNNLLMYSHGHIGISPQQMYPAGTPLIYPPSEGLLVGLQGLSQAGQGGFQGSSQAGQGGFQGPSQAGQGSPPSGHQSGDTDMFSEGSEATI